MGGVSAQPGNQLAEWTVAKYSSIGKQLWLQHHVGKMEGRNQLTDIALDAEGNVFALGQTQNVGAFLKNHLTVVKYDSNGNEVFARDFTDTPASDQHPGALAVEPASQFGGKIHQFRPEALDSTRGLGDYFVTKFNAQGMRQLQFRFTPGDFVTDAVVDPFGNLVVTGAGEDAQFNEDIFTIRLPRISLSVPPVAVQ